MKKTSKTLYEFLNFIYPNKKNFKNDACFFVFLKKYIPLLEFNKILCNFSSYIIFFREIGNGKQGIGSRDKFKGRFRE